MMIDAATGILQTIRYLPSPHYDLRPANTAINLLVLHNASLPPNNFGGPYLDDFFCGKLDAKVHPYFQKIITQRVAPHLLIRRDGGVTQYISFLHRAWHAGRSWFLGKSNCNDFSIGIELEGADDIPYTAEQYQQLAQITKLLLLHHPKITSTNIVGHCDIACDRKTDPGPAFSWVYFRSLLITTQNFGKIC